LAKLSSNNSAKLSLINCTSFSFVPAGDAGRSGL
jgi:hypothetical protein